jgi:hypothetical protein
MAQQLQEAIMKRYGALCFLPGGFLPIDYVLLDGDGRASEERERTEIEVEEVGSKYRMTAHFSLREQSKVEILSTLADQVASFLREVRMGTRLTHCSVAKLAMSPFGRSQRSTRASTIWWRPGRYPCKSLLHRSLASCLM